jgi:hypothetical protein
MMCSLAQPGSPALAATRARALPPAIQDRSLDIFEDGPILGTNEAGPLVENFGLHAVLSDLRMPPAGGVALPEWLSPLQALVPVTSPPAVEG